MPCPALPCPIGGSYACPPPLPPTHLHPPPPLPPPVGLTALDKARAMLVEEEQCKVAEGQAEAEVKKLEEVSLCVGGGVGGAFSVRI